jgi:hypothetical protein
VDWNAFASGVLGAGIGSSVVGILFKTYLDHRLAVERAQREELRRRQEKQREASVAVADILAEWVRSSYLGASSNEDRWRLQVAYWKGILSLDKRLIDLLLPALARRPGSAGTNELIVQARRILLDLEQADVQALQLNNWLPIEALKTSPDHA